MDVDTSITPSRKPPGRSPGQSILGTLFQSAASVIGLSYPSVTCRFPRERQEASDMPYLSSLGLHQYFAAQGGDPSMTEPFASAMPPPEMLAAQPFCLAGYDISSFSTDNIADPREFFADQGVLYRFVRCFCVVLLMSAIGWNKNL